ncbi:hypothetical protein Avbf_17737 [Armadillidium vulgare]|nr:hypothetical protein Avbf_17737 [Armadillidium vulgare]
MWPRVSLSKSHIDHQPVQKTQQEHDAQDSTPKCNTASSMWEKIKDIQIIYSIHITIEFITETLTTIPSLLKDHYYKKMIPLFTKIV